MTISNAVTWFEIGTDRPDEAQRFYGDLFGWSFTEQGTGEASYRTTEGGGAGIGGAIRGTAGAGPNYAIFYVQVADVAETCRRAEAAGGKVLVPTKRNDNGLTLAHLLDPAGNHVGVFAPPPGPADA
ncbi:VOC family protein [Micromonospora sp. 15K316]|uniref:VOC family protein n=1 Tax=Micromonospora sp. 15K316 TaxID=2530376 RepID=UPI001052D698|nr:VOC family protein [Micromonospora sp. 15K316]TDC36285.1 VOC family protein [Micromonospora sp. 15K316]